MSRENPERPSSDCRRFSCDRRPVIGAELAKRTVKGSPREPVKFPKIIDLNGKDSLRRQAG